MGEKQEQMRAKAAAWFASTRSHIMTDDVEDEVHASEEFWTESKQARRLKGQTSYCMKRAIRLD